MLLVIRFPQDCTPRSSTFVMCIAPVQKFASVMQTKLCDPNKTLLCLCELPNQGVKGQYSSEMNKNLSPGIIDLLDPIQSNTAWSQPMR